MSMTCGENGMISEENDMNMTREENDMNKRE